MTDPAPRSTRSVGELLHGLATDTALLLREEVELAQSELASAGRRGLREVAVLALACTVIGLGALDRVGVPVDERLLQPVELRPHPFRGRAQLRHGDGGDGAGGA